MLSHADLVRQVGQEAQVGDKRPLSRGAASYPRKRAVTACQVCRARRTKCDNLKPSCSFCLKVGAKCIQSPVDLSSFDPASLRILERLEELGSTLEQCRASISSLAHGGAISQISENGSSYQPSSPPEVEVDRSDRFLPPSIETISQWPILGLKDSRNTRARLSWPTGLAPDEAAPSPISRVDELEPRFTKPLLDRFFQYVHVKNPVLDEMQTRRMVSRFCTSGLDWTPESCLALLVLALGSIATPFSVVETVETDSEAFAMGKGFFRAAQKRLGLVMGSGGILEAQCFFLAGVYTITTFQRDAAWKFFLHALACCQSFQFLRAVVEIEHTTDTKEDNTNPILGDRSSLAAEQTIYWSAWKSERELRSDVSRPDFALSKADVVMYPAFFPTPPVLENAGSPNEEDDFQQRERLSWYFYLSEISLRRISSCIADKIAELERSERSSLEDLAQAAPMYEAQSEEWARALPHTVSIDCPPEKDDICRFVLRGHLLNLYEVIYWPFVDAAINRTEAEWESTPLVQSLVRKGLEKHVERIWANQPGFKHRHHGTPFLVQSCSRSGLVLMAAALSVQDRLKRGVALRFSMPPQWQQAVLLVIGLNQYWEAESADSRYFLRLLQPTWGTVQRLQV